MDAPARRQLGATATEGDRERAIRALRAAHAAGKLSHEELERRVGVAMSARTRFQVAGTHAGFTAQTLPERSRRFASKANRVALGVHATAYGGANGAAVGVWALAGEGLFWPALLLVPTTGLLAAHAAAAPVARRVLRRAKQR